MYTGTSSDAVDRIRLTQDAASAGESTTVLFIVRAIAMSSTA